MPDARAFILDNLVLEPAPGVPEIRLYRAHPASGLRRLVGDDVPPYWAYHWAGGTVLARHILDHPETFRGQRVLDLGTGSGLVAIAAAKSGATVTAVDIDPLAVAAARLNAEANGLAITVHCGDWLDGPAPECDLIMAGDIFYDATLAHRVTAALDRWGLPALVGDMGRTPLPRDRLTPLVHYEVPDFGHSGLLPAAVYRFRLLTA